VTTAVRNSVWVIIITHSHHHMRAPSRDEAEAEDAEHFGDRNRDPERQAHVTCIRLA